MTNPSDPWARRPDGDPVDGPTEKVTPGQGPAGHTPEPGDPHGATEYFGQQPGPDDTRIIPPHDAGWGQYEPGSGYGPTATYQPGGEYPPTASYQSGTEYPPTATYQAGGYAPSGSYGAAGYPGGAPGTPGGYQPPGFPQQPSPPKPPRKTGLWIGLGIGAFVLVAVAGVLAGALLANKDSSDSAASSSTTRTTAFAFPSLPNTSSQPLPSGVPEIPGLGDIDSLGANMGTIASNDGTTLTMTTLSGTTVTVHTDERTQVISLGSTKVADLPVGEMVMVQGDKASDGSVQAKIIISTSLPGGTR